MSRNLYLVACFVLCYFCLYLTKPNNLATHRLTKKLANGEDRKHDQPKIETISLQTQTSTSTRSVNYLRLAHGIILFVGFNVVPFVAILMTRFKPFLVDMLWLKLHIILVGILTPVLVVSGVGISICLAVRSNDSHFKSPHKAMGFSVLMLVFVQIILGIVINRPNKQTNNQSNSSDKNSLQTDTKTRNIKIRSVLIVAHHWIGRVAFLMAQLTIVYGILKYFNSNLDQVQWKTSTFLSYATVLISELFVYISLTILE